jgi:hypothetical protein
MTYKQLLHKIDEIQLSTFSNIEDFKNINLENSLYTNSQGLYWFWTNLTNEELKEIDTKGDSKEVPIDYLTERRESLNNICNYYHEGFRIVYNGIGSGLRERILQEINCNAKNTGTLNLQRRTNLENWRVSYFNFSDLKNHKIISVLGDFNDSSLYYMFSKDLELDWRLEFGTPILNRM